LQSKMSEYALSERMRRVQEIKARLTGHEDENDDDIDYFKRTRIQKDAFEERRKDAILEHRQRDKEMRETLGYTAWAEMRNKERQDRAKNSERESNSLKEETEERRLERAARREEIRAVSARSQEMVDIKKKWMEEDLKREKANADDERYRREVQWARQDAKKAAVRRERERYREERRLREDAQVVSHHVRDAEWEFQQNQEGVDNDEWTKAQEKRKKDYDRKLLKASLNVDSEDSGELTQADLLLRDSTRRTKNWDHRQRRVYQDETEMEKMKKWYTEKSLDRADFKREAIKAAHQGRKY